MEGFPRPRGAKKKLPHNNSRFVAQLYDNGAENSVQFFKPRVKGISFCLDW